MFLLFSLVIKQGVWLANKILLGYKSSSVIKGCWGEMLAKLIFSRTHSKCWSDGNAARIFTSFSNPWRPHAGPSLEENTDAAGFSHAHKQQNSWIFKFFPCSPQYKLVYTPQKQPFPTTCPKEFCCEASRWGPTRLRSGRTALAQQQWDMHLALFYSSLQDSSHLF